MYREMQRLKSKSARKSVKTEVDTQTQNWKEKKSWKNEMMSTQPRNSEKKSKRPRKSFIITNNTNVSLSLFGDDVNKELSSNQLNLSRHASVPATLHNSLTSSVEHPGRSIDASRNTDIRPKITITHLALNESNQRSAIEERQEDSSSSSPGQSKQSSRS